MPHIRKPPISAKVYRHFAAITVAVTFMLAVFADGENRQAMAQQVDASVSARKEAARVQAAQVAKFGKPKLVQRNPSLKRGWGYGGYGESFDSDYGEPSDRAGQFAGGTGGIARGRINPNAAMPGSYAPYGISKARWDAMSEEEREEFLRKQAAAQPPVSAEQHRREVEHLLAASAARAGTADDSESGGD